MQDETAIYLILKKVRARRNELKEVIAQGLPTMEEYVKAVGEHKAYTIMEQEIQDLQKKGFQRVKVDGEYLEISDVPPLNKKLRHNIDVIVD